MATPLILCALDANNDQISDVYAAHHGLSAGSGAEDPDFDGQDNETESVWGTDPFDHLSAFHPVSSEVLSGVFDFAIPTVVGKRYQFEGLSDLTDTWIQIDLPFAGTGATEHLLTALPIAGTDKFFWRVRANVDGDQLDAYEEQLLGTSDYELDSDYDKVNDVAEFLGGLNPAFSVDSEPDGLPDDWEYFYLGGTTADGTGNEDGDILTNLQKWLADTDPDAEDSGDFTILKMTSYNPPAQNRICARFLEEF
jgi:hypothetical protein